ncbi:SseB family protein [Thalassiella azotivora]
MSGPADHPGPGGPTDSAGVPWAGRTLTPTGFEGDDGTADPALAAVLRRYAAGEAGPQEVASALADVRVLVPVVAVLGEGEEAAATGPDGRSLTSDKSADMALVTLTSPDGRRALPVFTSTTSLASWDAAARPVPVGARRAALSAVDEGCSLLVLDPAGPVTAVLPRPAVWAVAQARPWTPSPQDPAVHGAVAAALAGVPGLLGCRCEPGGRTELRVVLDLPAGLGRSALDALTAEVTRRLAADGVVAERVDSLELRPRAVPRPT